MQAWGWGDKATLRIEGFGGATLVISGVGGIIMIIVGVLLI